MNSQQVRECKQTQVVQEHYAQIASIYDRRWDRYTRNSLRTLLDELDLVGEEDLLDVACGTGRLAAMIRERHPRMKLLGTDLSPEMIRIAEQRQPTDERTRWYVGPADALPASNESVDIVTCANAFHLVPNQAAALEEFSRVLKPGGRFAIVDWCREYPTVWLLLIVSRMFGRQFRRVLTSKELAAMVEAAGFRVTRVFRFKATWFWGLMCLVAEKPR